MILFHERVADIAQGISYLQYANNILIGAESLDKIWSIDHQVLAQFDEYRVKANYDKGKWVTEAIQFIGCEISNGYWSYENFLKKKLQDLGEIQTIRDLECIIGVISYICHCVKDVEVVLGPLWEGLKTVKSEEVLQEWIEPLNIAVKEVQKKQQPVYIG